MNEHHVNALLDWIDDKFRDNQPSNTFDFLSGMSLVVADFSIWKDGERYFGCNGYTFKEFNEAMRRFNETLSASEGDI